MNNERNILMKTSDSIFLDERTPKEKREEIESSVVREDKMERVKMKMITMSGDAMVMICDEM